MVKNIPAHLRDRARKCIFCGEPGVTETHVWPDWLGRLVPTEEEFRKEEHFSRNPPELPTPPIEVTEKRGRPFSIRPRLAFGTCNSGWMNRFEDEMKKFAKPIFTGEAPVHLTEHQTRVLVGWITLITILAEYINHKIKDGHPITREELLHFKKYRYPPDNWTIVVSSLDALDWRQKYRHHYLHIAAANYEQPLPFAFHNSERPNTQISSFGIGKLFVQIFSCPVERFVGDFRIATKSAKLVQLWPLPIQFWPFSKRFAKFPTKRVLDSDAADELASSFHDRLRLMTKYIGKMPTI